LAFLLYLAEAFSFIFAMHLLIGDMADWRASRQGRSGGSGDVGGGGGQLKVVVGNSKRPLASVGGAVNTASREKLAVNPANLHPANPATLTLAIAGSGGQLARHPNGNLSEERARVLEAAADWFTRGGSPWRSRPPLRYSSQAGGITCGGRNGEWPRNSALTAAVKE
jgi:hypothetical protein